MTLALVASLAAPTAAQAQTAAAPCQFILGFRTLHDMDPVDVGDCVDNQLFAPNGDAQQHTRRGLLAWRKVDNYTVFTNGYMTWINGPDGLVSRLNTDRFPWERDIPIAQPVPVTAPTPVPTPDPNQPQPSIVIDITDRGYGPSGTIWAGGSVTWINRGSRPHTVTSIPGHAPWAFDSGGINPGDSVSYKLDIPGSYMFSSSMDCLNGVDNPGSRTGFDCSIWPVLTVKKP